MGFLLTSLVKITTIVCLLFDKSKDTALHTEGTVHNICNLLWRLCFGTKSQLTSLPAYVSENSIVLNKVKCENDFHIIPNSYRL